MRSLDSCGERSSLEDAAPDGPSPSSPLCSVCLQTYLGDGPTKRHARLNAATLALLSSVQFPDECLAHHVISAYLPPKTFDFTSDQATDDALEQHPDEARGSNHSSLRSSGQSRKSEAVEGGWRRKRRRRMALDPLEIPWNPVSILNDIRPQSRYQVWRPSSSAGGAARGHRRTICISVTFDGMTFDGFGRCQRSAKQRAAQSALSRHFNFRFIGSSLPRPTTVGPPHATTNCQLPVHLPTSLAERSK